TVGDIVVAMAMTDRSAGSRGISAFIIEKGTPGLRPGKKEDKLGMRASETSEVLFDQCAVPEAQRLGRLNHGFTDAMHGLDGGATRGGAGSRRSRSAWPKARSKPRCTMPRNAAPSARPSPGFRRFSGSLPTTPRGSKRRGC